MRRLLAALALVVCISPADAAYRAPTIGPDALVRRMDVLVVDTRSAQAYAQEHIYGAVNVPGSALRTSARGLPRDKTLVFYCTCPQDHGAHDAAQRMHDRHGYRRLLVLEGGMDAWREAGYPMMPPSARRVLPTPSPTPSPSPSPIATPTAPTAPDQFDPMDERRGTGQPP
jgi:rhodanese-related sulfurtransferase